MTHHFTDTTFTDGVRVAMEYYSSRAHNDRLQTIAATGARTVTTIANEMKRNDNRYGLASICGTGATAVAMLLERS